MSRRAMRVTEHDQEAQPGLPEPLPAGERMLWQGAPDWRVLAQRSFHLRKLAVYFAVLIAWRVVSSLHDGAPLAQALAGSLWTLPLAAAALGIVAALAALVARTTLYTLTDRRVVMRIGVVLSVTFNLPLRRIESARMHTLPGGAGDLALVLDPSDRIGYVHLWPHARPWRFERPEPTLRALRDVQAVARLLGDALAASTAAGSTTMSAPRGTPSQARGGAARQPAVARAAA